MVDSACAVPLHRARLRFVSFAASAEGVGLAPTRAVDPYPRGKRAPHLAGSLPWGPRGGAPPRPRPYRGRALPPELQGPGLLCWPRHVHWSTLQAASPPACPAKPAPPARFEPATPPLRR